MIAKKLIAALFALAVPSLIWAVPADPRVRTLKNPDGSIVKVRVHGDESFHFMTDENSSVIMQRDADGFLVKAMRDGVPLAFNRENVEMLRAESGAPKFTMPEPASGKMSKMASLSGEGRSTYPTIGNGTRSLVVLVEFQDVKFIMDNPKQYFTRQLNEPGFSDYGGKGSALDYFKTVSHGLYTPQFDVYGPVTISKEASYFAHSDEDTSSNMDVIIKEALTSLHDSGELKLTDYDFDNDGTLDTVFIYYAGYGSADSDTPTIWPHQYDYAGFVYNKKIDELILDGIKVGPYACANELKGWNPQTKLEPWKDGSEPWVDGIGTFVHEYGHVLGLPDLYDVEYSEEGVVTPGMWDVMDAGCYNFDGCVPPLYSAYEQWVCNWLEFTDAEEGKHYDFVALGNSDTPTAVRIRIPKLKGLIKYEPEYFIIEARDNSGWDSCFPKSGIMIWRINYDRNLWYSNKVNSKNGSNVEIIYAEGDRNPLFTEGSIAPGSAHELIPSDAYEGWKSPFITNLAYDDDTKKGSCDFNLVTEAPELEVILSDRPYADEGAERNFTLEWQAAEGADSYLLTIKRVSTGKPFGVYDEFNVGNVTSHKVVSVALGYWNNEIEAYVRAVKSGMPCSNTSNVVRFVPKDLQRGNNGDDPGAVEDLDAEMLNISGGYGCVNAPEGASVYDMSGKKLRRIGLAPGVYVVVYGSHRVKVQVQ